MTTQALTIAQHTDPDPGWWTRSKEQATILLKSGFLPSSIKTAEQALAVMIKGFELGLPRMYALSNIVIVAGKPTISAEALLTLVHRDYGTQAMRVQESTNDHCTVEWRQPGWDGTQTYTFSLKDAQLAGLATKDIWKQYPAAMLRARAISASVRMAFPECGAGMYTPGELGDAVEITDEGTVVSAGLPDADPVGFIPMADDGNGGFSVDTELPPDPKPEVNPITALHDLGEARGLGSDDDRTALHRHVHTIMEFHYPGVESLTDLAIEDLRHLYTKIKEADDDTLQFWATDWLMAITDADSSEALEAISRTFKRFGCGDQTHPHFAQLWQHRRGQLAQRVAA